MKSGEMLLKTMSRRAIFKPSGFTPLDICNVDRHADAASEQIGHQTGFEQAEFQAVFIFAFPQNVDLSNTTNDLSLLLGAGLCNKQALHLSDIEVLLSEAALHAKNLVFAERRVYPQRQILR